MLKKIINTLLFMLLFYGISTGQDSALPVIPKPVHVIKGKGFVNISAQWKIYIPYAEWNSEADFFNDYLKKNYGFVLPVLNSIPKGKNFILLNKPFGDRLSKDFYRISITENKISIDAGESSGIFYGLQTLIQLCTSGKKEEITVPRLEMEDYPRFRWRGMHLDVSRHFFPKEDIKKYIDHLSQYKMNVFHWHLTDDQGWRIEIKGHPELTTTGAWRNGSMIGPYADQKFDTVRYGGFYTQNEIREIVDYAVKRHVTIVPEIEMPGHCMAVLAANPQLSCSGGPFEVGKIWGVYNDVFCTKEETFKFLDDVLTEVCELFPGKYIHIGGDEVPKTRWQNCANCQTVMKTQGLKNEAALQTYFTSRIEKMLNAKGKLVIGWDEILANQDSAEVPSSAAIMSWQGEKGGIAAAKQKHFAVMTPGDYCYFDHYQSSNRDEPLAFGGYTSVEKVYSYEPVPKELSKEEEMYILGAQGNLWTEYIPDFSQVEYMIFPRMCALAEVLWSPREENRKFEDFRERLLKHFVKFDKNGIHYSKAIFDIMIHVNPSENNEGIQISFDAFRRGIDKIRFTLDGTDPTDKSPVAEHPVQLTNSAIVKAALFEDKKQAGKIVTQKISINKTTGKKITLAVQPSEKYNTGGAFALVNGITGELPWRGADWLGFSGDNLDAVIDFGKEENFSKVTLEVLEDTGSWIYLPASAELSSSDDGINFKSLQKLSSEEIKQMKNHLVFEVNNTKARYLKIVVYNKGIIPVGSPGENNQAWVFTGEIKVE